MDGIFLKTLQFERRDEIHCWRQGEKESENWPKLTSVRAWQDFSLYPAGLQIRLTPELISVLPPSHAQHNILLMQWKHFLIINCLQKEKYIGGPWVQALDTKPFDQQNINHLETTHTHKSQDSVWVMRYTGKWFVTMFVLQTEDYILIVHFGNLVCQIIHSYLHTIIIYY